MAKFIYIIFFYSSFFLAQISLDIKFNTKVTNNNSPQLLEIKIKNNSRNYYALPLDTLDFKPFYNNEPCVDFSDPESYKDLMLKSCIVDLNDNSPIMPIPEFKLMGRIDENDKKVVVEMNKRDSLLQIQNQEIKSWTRKNRISQNSIWAIKNKFLYSNIILLEPEQEIVYCKYFTPDKLNSDKISRTYDHYDLNADHHYNFSLKYCIDKYLYTYLTKGQKQKLKKYILFSGKVESNKIVYK